MFVCRSVRDPLHRVETSRGAAPSRRVRWPASYMSSMPTCAMPRAATRRRWRRPSVHGRARRRSAHRRTGCAGRGLANSRLCRDPAGPSMSRCRCPRRGLVAVGPTYAFTPDRYTQLHHVDVLGMPCVSGVAPPLLPHRWTSPAGLGFLPRYTQRYAALLARTSRRQRPAGSHRDPAPRPGAPRHGLCKTPDTMACASGKYLSDTPDTPPSEPP